MDCLCAFDKVVRIKRVHTQAEIFMQRLEKFIKMSGQHKFLLARAWVLLGYYRFAILTRSFKRLTQHLEHHRSAIPLRRLSESQRSEAKAIGSLVASASRRTPWQSLCLVQVLVVQRLLAERNIPGQFFLGVCKDSSGQSIDKTLAAHAWLQCDNDIVNGSLGHEQFAVVSTFSWDSGSD